MQKLNSFYFFPICCLLIFLRLEIFYGSDIKAPFTDDFYYYLKTSKNFIENGVISFDNISSTNGFQPLWFLYISFLYLVINNEIIFNSTIIISIFILCFFSYFNFKNFLIKNNFSSFDSHLISSLISYLVLFFSKNGMESALAVYFFSLSLIFLNKNIIIFSLLSFLSFLSRLEFLILYFFILSYELFFKKKILILDFLLKFYFFTFTYNFILMDKFDFIWFYSS